MKVVLLVTLISFFLGSGICLPLKPYWVTANPPPMDSYASAVSGNYIYIFGGMTDSGRKFLDTIFRYDTTKDEFVEIVAPNGPGARGELAALTAADGKILVIGGRGDGFPEYPAMDVFEFNPGTNEWTKWAPISGAPEPRSQHSFVLGFNNKGYLFGGSSNEGGNQPKDFRELWELDTTAKSWRLLADNSLVDAPARRGEVATHMIDLTGGNFRFYVFGGHSLNVAQQSDVSGQDFNDLWNWVEHTNPQFGFRWIDGSITMSPTSQIPIEMGNYAYVNSGSKLIIFGGETKFSFFQDSVYSIDLSTTAYNWVQQTTTGEKPDPRAAMKGSLIGKEMYFFGGRGDLGRKNDVYSLNIDTWIWTKRSREPIPLYGHSSIKSNGEKMYIFGGYQNALALGCCVKNTVSKFDLATRAWLFTEQTGNPGIRRYHSAVNYNNNMIIFGGENGATPSPTVYNDMWSYSMDSGETWTQISQTNTITARYGHSATMWGADKMVIYGGTQDGSNSESTVEIFDFTTNTWNSVTFEPQFSQFLKPRHFHSATLVPPNSLYIFGGTQSGQPSSQFFQIGLNGDVVETILATTVFSEEAPRTVGHSSFWLPTSKLFIFLMGLQKSFSETSSSLSNRIFQTTISETENTVFDISDNNAYLLPRNHPSVIEFNGYLYVWGGETTEGTNDGFVHILNIREPHPKGEVTPLREGKDGVVIVGPTDPVATTGVATTGNPTTGNPTTGGATTGVATTGNPTTGGATTENPTGTGQQTKTITSEQTFVGTKSDGGTEIRTKQVTKTALGCTPGTLGCVCDSNGKCEDLVECESGKCPASASQANSLIVSFSKMIVLLIIVVIFQFFM